MKCLLLTGDSFLTGLVVGIALCLAYNLLRSQVFVSFPEPTPTKTVAMPLRMRKVSYRSSTRGNDDAPGDEARDNYTRDDRDDDTTPEMIKLETMMTKITEMR